VVEKWVSAKIGFLDIDVIAPAIPVSRKKQSAEYSKNG
jgi:hypothetical protein